MRGRWPYIWCLVGCCRQDFRRTRHAGHCWRNRDELISDVLLWTLTYGRAKAGRPARTYIQQLCEDTGCSPEDVPEAMNDREKWRERVRDIRASGTTWWWWVPKFLIIYYNISYTKMELSGHPRKHLVWLGLVLWQINYCRLFNTKSIFIHISISFSNNSV